MILIVRGLIGIFHVIISCMNKSDVERSLKKFGERLREVRKTKNLSQEQLADLCELDRTYVGGIERGERNVSLINILKLASSLEVETSTLFTSLTSKDSKE